jgi:hypothetical protein
MNNYLKRIGYVLLSGLFMAIVILAMPGYVSAVTLNELDSMLEAGLSADVMIKVIDATGIDFTVNTEILVSMKEQGYDDSVLSRLAEFIPSDDETGANGKSENTGNEDSNLFGGEGFHSREPGYSDRRYDQNYYPGYDQKYNGYDSRYDGSPDYSNPFNTPLGSIWVYRPPVYIANKGPYYGRYPVPQYYQYYRGYGNNGGYIIYDNTNFPYSYPPYGDGMWGQTYGYNSDWYWDWRMRERRHDRDNSVDLGYRDDHFRIRIHF